MAEPIQGPVFAAAGLENFRALSVDGVNWFESPKGNNIQQLYVVCFHRGALFTMGQHAYGTQALIYRTTDGLDWSNPQPQPATPRAHGAFSFNGKIHYFSGIGDRGRGSLPTVLSSEDGLNWSEEVKLPDPKDRHAERGHGPILRRAAIGPDRAVMVGDFGRRVVTRDGVTWEDAPWHDNILNLIDIAYGNDTYVCTGLHGVRVSSQNGMDWKEPQHGEEGEHINSILFDGKQFVGVGEGATYFSENGESWRRVLNKNAPNHATLGNGLYVGFSWPGRIFTSKDAVEWEQVAELDNVLGGIGFGTLEGIKSQA